MYKVKEKLEASLCLGKKKKLINVFPFSKIDFIRIIPELHFGFQGIVDFGLSLYYLLTETL